MIKLLALFVIQLAFFVVLTSTINSSTITAGLTSSVIVCLVYWCLFLRGDKKNQISNKIYFYNPICNPISLCKYLVFIFVEIYKSSLTIIKSIIKQTPLQAIEVKYAFKNDIFCKNDTLLYLFIFSVTITPGTIFDNFCKDSNCLIINCVFDKKTHEIIYNDLKTLENNLLQIFNYRQ